ncbi:MAG: type II toxin-antitoxin system HicA family toxin [bacterium]
MPKQPVASARQVVAALERAGYERSRQAGSHVILIHREQKRAVVVPVHGSRDLPPGTLHRILKQAGMTVDEFRQLIK